MNKAKRSRTRHQQILDAAKKIVVKYGSENVTINKIAKEVGITEGAIYRHFSSKSDLLLQLADTIIVDLSQGFPDNYSSYTNEIDIIENVLKEHFIAIENRKGSSFQVIAEIVSFGDKTLNNKIYTTIDLYINELSKLISAGKEHKQIRADIDTKEAAILLFGMIQGLVNMWTLSGYKFNLQESYSRSWKILYNAMKN